MAWVSGMEGVTGVRERGTVDVGEYNWQAVSAPDDRRGKQKISKSSRPNKTIVKQCSVFRYSNRIQRLIQMRKPKDIRKPDKSTSDKYREYRGKVTATPECISHEYG